jgi:hypothetical protein
VSRAEFNSVQSRIADLEALLIRSRTAPNALLLEGQTWEAPGKIGSASPNTGAFTTIAASGDITETRSVNGFATVGVTNANAGATAVARLITSNGANFAAMGVMGASFTTAGIYSAGNSYFGSHVGGNSYFTSYGAHVYLCPAEVIVADITSTGMTIMGTLGATGAFGANNATPQTAYASGGAAPAGGTGAAAGGWDTAGHRDSAIALLNNIRAALVNNGILS